ncbi:MAG: hypothetical protein MJ210_05865 [Alphaproteobacteria bacterium]|nr:hypothetical protein [Alphaproteobacteria bacterium]
MGNISKLIKLDLLTASDVDKVLRNISKYDPKNRLEDRWDKKFYQLVPVLHKYENGLKFLNTYGHVRNTYFKKLEQYHPDRNFELQQAFCQVEYYIDGYYPKYGNLLCSYLDRYKLMNEVYLQLFKDEKYAIVLKTIKSFK